jgi:polyisoprenoid-binding protein YceI
VQAFASGLIAAVAHSPKIGIRDWTGTVQMASSAMENASLEVRVSAASLEVLDELRDADRREIHRVMNHEVLETTRSPEVVYDSTEIAVEKLKDDLYSLNVHGD